MNFNSLTLCGRVARTEEIVWHGAGNPCLVFCLAVETRLGNDRKELLYLDCSLWGKQAENLHEHISKGREVIVHGRLKLDCWADKHTGQKRNKHTCVVNKVELGMQPRGQQVVGAENAHTTAQSQGYSSPYHEAKASNAGAQSLPHEGSEDLSF